MVFILNFIRLIPGFFWIAGLQAPITVSSQHQGIEGDVYLVSGNQMPSPDRKTPAPRGIRATLFIYELTNCSQVNRKGLTPYFTAIRTQRIRQVETDNQGYFTTELPEGVYSLFLKRGSLFYSNSFDSHNNIFPVRVTAGKMTRVKCTLEGDRPAVN